MSHKKDLIQELSDRDWLLKRGHNIIGSLQSVKAESYLFNADTEKFQWISYEHIPGLTKIINEIIDNSIDVAIKSDFQYANEISIELSSTKAIIKDNGYGIPVEVGPDGTYIPVIAWGRARAGSNFEDDEDRTHAGMNGIGSYATVVFSKNFTGITDDGKKRLKVKFKDNGLSYETIETESIEQGTSVVFTPDLSRFNLTEISELHQSLIYQRILNLSVMYPEIKFKFNKRVVNLNAKKFLSYFSDDFEFMEEDNYLIAVFPNEASDFKFHTYVNALWLPKGGNHINYITGKIVDDIRSRLVRRYKSIKPGDIKNKLSILVFFKGLSNPKFDGQTKELLTNSQKDVTSFMSANVDLTKDWDKFATKIYKNKEIIEPIIDIYKAKMIVDEKKKLKTALKQQDLPEKYWPATKINKNLFIAEGDSAINAVIAEVGRSINGFFPLKGVPLNVIKDKSKVSSNLEIKQLAGILGIDLTDYDNINLEYQNLIIAADKDVDGDHITGLILGFFKTYCPWYLDNGKVFRFVTPLITVYKKDGSVFDFIFSMKEYDLFISKNDPKHSKYIYDYKKGLGTLEEQEWEALFKMFSLDELLQPLHLLGSDDPDAEIQELNNWLDEDSEFRKSQIQNKLNDFDINLI